MLKNIRLHVLKDEQAQEQIESEQADLLEATRNKNANAFQRYIPSLVPFLGAKAGQNISVFCNKFGEFNIVDYGLGRTFYGLHPSNEVEKQISQFRQHSQYVDLKHKSKSIAKNEMSRNTGMDIETLDSFQQLQNHKELPSHVECLVIFGLGLGLHVHKLVETHHINHIIIYEPEVQYFQCSALVSDWKKTLELAKSKNTSVYMQIGKDGRDLLADISQLQTVISLDGFYLYQHYHHPVFTSIRTDLNKKNWTDIEKAGFSFNLTENINQYCPAWSEPVNLFELEGVHTTDEKFQQNLQALKKYFPEIYDEFKDYEPEHWIPARMPNGEINIIKTDTLFNWYGEEPKNECNLHYYNFNEQPNKDGLILGYNGKKLAHYLHYQYVNETEKLIKAFEEETGTLPELLKSIIFFGIGIGYQLEELFENHTVEKIFICEPNRDFFFASLFAVDWDGLLSKIDQTQARIYLNIGDDGSNIMRDLLNQFYSIGPYILNNTYFYQSYYNASLNASISQLRQQLQIVICMGEYFDHAYYGIAQTKYAIEKQYGFLKSSPRKYLTPDDKEVPVFLVGNGPSLDQSIATIKEWQDKAIIISCGTCLQVLYKNGIKPDFHAEIEQNRTTFDWANMIGDNSFLKDVNVLSCNGLHPDTCSLYKDVFIAFKEGESSTVSSLEILGEDNYSTLEYSFPTVANFASNFVSLFGFENIYFIGIDLGFYDKKYHHSKASEYYRENGEEVFDYEEVNITSLIAEGNFRKFVNTKHEFKVAKELMELSIIKSGKNTNFYNCSDGAKIAGAQPLPLENILVTSSAKQKHACLKNIKSNAFGNVDVEVFNKKFEEKYQLTALSEELAEYLKLLDDTPSDFDQAERIMEKQKEYLFDSYRRGKSLLFYYLYGTINYTNALFSKMLYSSTNEDTSVARFIDALEIWRNYFSKIKELATEPTMLFDGSKSFNSKDILNKQIAKYCEGKTIPITSNSLSFVESFKAIVSSNQEKIWRKAKFTFAPMSGQSNETGPHALSVVFWDSFITPLNHSAFFNDFRKLSNNVDAEHQVIILDTLLDLATCKQAIKDNNNLTILMFPRNPTGKEWPGNTLWIARRSITALLGADNFDVLIPKIHAEPNTPARAQLKAQYSALFSNDTNCVEFSECFGFRFAQNYQNDIICFGEKGRIVPNKHMLDNLFIDLNRESCQQIANKYEVIPALKSLPQPDQIEFDEEYAWSYYDDVSEP